MGWTSVRRTEAPRRRNRRSNDRDISGRQGPCCHWGNAAGTASLLSAISSRKLEVFRRLRRERNRRLLRWHMALPRMANLLTRNLSTVTTKRCRFSRSATSPPTTIAYRFRSASCAACAALGADGRKRPLREHLETLKQASGEGRNGAV